MRKTFVQWLFSVVLLAVVPVFGTVPDKKEPVRHVVIFKYKAGSSEDQIRQATDAFRSLKGKIPGIVSFECGPNISSEGKNLGFNYVYMLTFEDAKARDNYLPHPDHQKFGELLGRLGVVEDVFVVDFVPKN